MAPEVLQALISLVIALVSGLCVAIPSVYQTKQNNKLTMYRIEQLENTVKTLNEKLDDYNELSRKMTELDVRLTNVEKHLEKEG